LTLPNRAHYAADFFEVLDRRQSSANLGPIDIPRLSTFLWFAHHTDQFVSGKKLQWQHRPSPSAGGIYPIDFVLSNVPDQTTSLLSYDAAGHLLYTLTKPISPNVVDLNTAALQVKPEPHAVVIWFVAHPYLVTAKYRKCESLIWRDAGALLATCYLVATALGLKGCALGLTGEPYLSKMIHPNIRGVGAFLLGT
jgi:SagB-type dehydrogenase family enzyme